MTAETHLQGVEISAAQFFEIWHHYDSDGNGFMDGKELQNFIQELQQARKKAGLQLNSDRIKSFIRMFDANNDGKLELTELARLLPVQENFLIKFQGVKMCAKEFNNAFEMYDQDGNGYIDENELDALLKDLCEKNKKELDITNLATYKKSIMALSDGGKLYRAELLRMFDANNDGKLELTELARLLPVQENFLIKFQGVKMCAKEFNNAFEMYDQDGNGYIDENELDALLKDLCEKNKKELDITNLATYKKSIMALSDGGKLYRAELALILCAEEN
ncbi:calbindin [Passer montanus]|uniref:calbindin n=1 Tax=Passer montanus TaxID=9160 RepID=UPI00195FD5A7|nr:calbindin [Passer montanus]